MSVSIANSWDISHVMEEMPYGLYIVGSADEGGVPNGMMADWVMQVAFKPRLIAVSIENDAHTLANLRLNRRFTVNLLPQDEIGRQLAMRFCQPYDDAKVGHLHQTEPHAYHLKLDGVVHTTIAGGAPVLAGALSWMDCEVRDFFPVGDHTLVTGQVLDGAVLQEAEPLTSAYTGWNYSG